MLRPSPNHGTQRLPNDDDDEMETITIFEMVRFNNGNTLKSVKRCDMNA